MSQFSNFPKIFSPGTQILVAPLDWGLGHATRCIPLISHLLNNLDAKVLVAAEGPQKAIITEAFPGIRFLSPPPYHIKYHKNRAATIAGLVLSIPRIVRIIRREAAWLKDVVDTERIEAVISDNRYGLSHPAIPSFLVTHQLMVKTPFGAWADRLVQRSLYQWINRFTECWVPDFESGQGLAGELSHPSTMPGIPVKYLGPLSRLSNRVPNGETRLLVLLSGPEPQRTLLEKEVIRQWNANPGQSMVLVRGLPDSGGGFLKLPEIPNATIYNHLPADKLSQEVANAQSILCRSGYSTIMDLLPLGKRCFMVPTPGQTEQEYLAGWLSSQGKITAIRQDRLNLSDILHT
ncbi:glycosyltransferase [Flavihumibacter stibioxidans]|uniref:Glycosyl transferase family 28 C-terminal domain-containing protein n=1 Tax=Flavihumibacter stibioxidans TaxID=1834163 RepID=A0ABR7MCE0_9BACT|nr:glycosyltransferase [Flavihumibacter stibioxidans]MBC6492708.1 hypothetical protein [Flavihumibacter stibioxidans]